nr:MAG TPA: hypothetical protein [Caudoviricetes sp.]
MKEYITYKRFKAHGIDGKFNLPYGTTVYDCDGLLITAQGRRICRTTSENGWNHFRENTPEGLFRQKMLNELYCYYRSGRGDTSVFEAANWPNATNLYWKQLLRTMKTPDLTRFYSEHVHKKCV